MSPDVDPIVIPLDRDLGDAIKTFVEQVDAWIQTPQDSYRVRGAVGSILFGGLMSDDVDLVIDAFTRVLAHRQIHLDSGDDLECNIYNHLLEIAWTFNARYRYHDTLLEHLEYLMVYYDGSDELEYLFLVEFDHDCRYAKIS